MCQMRIGEKAHGHRGRDAQRVTTLGFVLFIDRCSIIFAGHRPLLDGRFPVQFGLLGFARWGGCVGDSDSTRSRKTHVYRIPIPQCSNERCECRSRVVRSIATNRAVPLLPYLSDENDKSTVHFPIPPVDRPMICIPR